MAHLTAVETNNCIDSIYQSLFGAKIYAKWKDFKKRLEFYSETDFVHWMLTYIEDKYLRRELGENVGVGLPQPMHHTQQQHHAYSSGGGGGGGMFRSRASSGQAMSTGGGQGPYRYTGQGMSSIKQEPDEGQEGQFGHIKEEMDEEDEDEDGYDDEEDEEEEEEDDEDYGLQRPSTDNFNWHHRSSVPAHSAAHPISSVGEDVFDQQAMSYDDMQHYQHDQHHQMQPQPPPPPPPQQQQQYLPSSQS